MREWQQLLILFTFMQVWIYRKTLLATFVDASYKILIIFSNALFMGLHEKLLLALFISDLPDLGEKPDGQVSLEFYRTYLLNIPWEEALLLPLILHAA